MPNAASVVTQTALAGYPCRRGKVRDVYDLGDELLLVATDRLSAYDVVLPTPIPGKGAMLTRISKFWFERFADVTPHHLLEVFDAQVPVELAAYAGQLRGRTMRCKKCAVVPIECVVRGYLAGSGWSEYRATGRVCGIDLPAGLTPCAQLPEPLFTPSTKAVEGHDENISFEQACALAGREVMKLLRRRSLELYARAAEYARTRGIIIADTKFEWGRQGADFLLVDEVLTPDSSRFWPADAYAPGRDQDSFDKQYVRNYLAELCAAGRWDKTPPGPELPEFVVQKTAAKYREAVERLTS